MRKLSSFSDLDVLKALCLTLCVWCVGLLLPNRLSNDYFGATIASLKSRGTFFLSDPSYFTELIPTVRGYILTSPPFPLLPTWLGSLFTINEFVMTQLGIALSIALMYLILRHFRYSPVLSFVGSVLYLLTTPLLYFFTHSGYWYSAQVWGVLATQLALLFLFTSYPLLSGVSVAIAILSRPNLGVVTAVGFALYYLVQRRSRPLLTYLAPIALSGATYLLWNQYRFGSPWETGYRLIPGVLQEPWYAAGIMHPSYIMRNLPLFLWQYDTAGSGLGIIWAQPYLLLAPWFVNKKNWGLMALGFVQFVVVLCHGWWGASQFDFRFLMDSLWLWFPALFLSRSPVKLTLLWMLLGLSAGVHLSYI